MFCGPHWTHATAPFSNGPTCAEKGSQPCFCLLFVPASTTLRALESATLSALHYLCVYICVPRDVVVDGSFLSDVVVLLPQGRCLGAASRNAVVLHMALLSGSTYGDIVVAQNWRVEYIGRDRLHRSFGTLKVGSP